MGEFVLALVEFVERRGKPGAVVSIVVGLMLVPVGVWLAFGMLGTAPADAELITHAQEGDSLSWPIMLVVSVAGLGMIGIGSGALLGTQRRMQAFLDGDAPSPAGSGDLVRTVEESALPFWVCGDCRVIEPGVSMTDRCMRCGSIAGFVAVAEDRDRSMASSLLG